MRTCRVHLRATAGRAAHARPRQVTCGCARAKPAATRHATARSDAVSLPPAQFEAQPSLAPSLVSYTIDGEPRLEPTHVTVRIAALKPLRDSLVGRTPAEQVEVLSACQDVQRALGCFRFLAESVPTLDLERQAAVLATIAAGQLHVVTLLPEGPESESLPAFQKLADQLQRVQLFYSSLGGIVGYQLKCLELIHAAVGDDEGADGADGAASDEVSYLVPQGLNLQGQAGRATALTAALAGLDALPHLAEILPLGGAGDRLGLVCEDTGAPLPAAMLPYSGRPIIEGIVRDLFAREFLYFQVHGVQLHTPVAVMTSDAKGNHTRMVALLHERGHFGRGEDGFRLFSQPLVPVLEVGTGEWVLPEPLKPGMKPGGHGAIWKLMHDEGVFEWLAEHGCTAATVRQISNPMAATDCTLLALAGEGARGRHAFGFASCDRVVGAAEGMNVLQERRLPAADGDARPQFEYGISNVEYTEFQRLGIPDQPVHAGSNKSAFPANTNILYVGLDAAAQAVRQGIKSGGGAALPGMIFNRSKQITFTSAVDGAEHTVAAGRMECTMQNLADSFSQCSPVRLRPSDARTSLDTFVVFNERRYVTSSAKRAVKPGSVKIHQTPQGSFYDLMRNAADLLERCDVRAPAVAEVAEYVGGGCVPAFIWLWNPALGPLWRVVAQKVQGGTLAAGAEVVLEVAEAHWSRVKVDGSLHVVAEQPLGAAGPDGRLVFDRDCARVWLQDVQVRNRGVDYDAEGNCYWKHRVARNEMCMVRLQGRSGFRAVGVTLDGDREFTVPDGFVLTVIESENGLVEELEPIGPSNWWRWEYEVSETDVVLSLSEGCEVTR